MTCSRTDSDLHLMVFRPRNRRTFVSKQKQTVISQPVPSSSAQHARVFLLTYIFSRNQLRTEAESSPNWLPHAYKMVSFPSFLPAATGRRRRGAPSEATPRRHRTLAQATDRAAYAAPSRSDSAVLSGERERKVVLAGLRLAP